jgi:hypothetical protein
LVVKNGSNRRAWTLASMPVPLSATSISALAADGTGAPPDALARATETRT